jgi:hypothetical protein
VAGVETSSSVVRRRVPPDTVVVPDRVLAPAVGAISGVPLLAVMVFVVPAIVAVT